MSEQLQSWLGWALLTVAVGAWQIAAPASGQVTLLSGFESPDEVDDGDGMVEDGEALPSFATAGGMVALSQESSVGVTEGSSSLRIEQFGNEQGGGTTHFDRPAVINYAATNPAFSTLQEAALAPEFFTIQFDVTFDVDNLPSFQEGPFIGVGFFADSDVSGFTDACFEATCDGFSIINPDDFTGQTPTGTVTVPFADTAIDTAPEDFVTFGFSFNGNWTTGETAAVFIDNLRLVEFVPADEIDFDGDGDGDLDDYAIFIANHLVAEPAFGDLDGDGDNDFLDFAEFERLFDLANPVSLQQALAGVPEPSTGLLVAAGAAGLACLRRRKLVGVLGLLLAAGFAAGPVEAQTGTVFPIESFEDGLGGYEATNFAQAGANPSVGLSGIGATDGTMSLAVTQAEDTAAVSLNAIVQYGTGSPQFDVFANALEVGDSFFDFVFDVTYDEASLPDVSDISVTVSLGSSTGGNQIDGLAEFFPGGGDQTLEVRLPLSDFPDLGEVEADGVTIYSTTLGFGGTQDLTPYTVFFDNFRLEQTGEPDLLTLEVDRETGDVTIINESDNPIDFSYYEITSGAGSLNLAGWNSLDDQNLDAVDGPDPGSTAGDIPGEGWAEAAGASASQLAEAFLVDETVLDPAATLSLGSAFDIGINSDEEFAFQFRRPDRPRTLQDGIVRFIGDPPAGVTGDFNGDGVVDAADYTVWRDNLGESVTLPNDDTPGTVDLSDYEDWVANFGLSSGGQLTAVPEPAAGWLLLLAAGVSQYRRRE